MPVVRSNAATPAASVASVFAASVVLLLLGAPPALGAGCEEYLLTQPSDSSAPSPNPPSRVLSYASINAILVTTNNERRSLGNASTMPMMQWSAELANHVQTYLDACPGLQHSTEQSRTFPGSLGLAAENLASGGGDDWNHVNGGVFATNAWISEKQHWTYPNECAADIVLCNQYTNIIRASTTSIGCGYAFCPSSGQWPHMWGCLYGPSAQGAQPFDAAAGNATIDACQQQAGSPPLTPAPPAPPAPPLTAAPSNGTNSTTGAPGGATTAPGDATTTAPSSSGGNSSQAPTNSSSPDGGTATSAPSTGSNGSVTPAATSADGNGTTNDPAAPSTASGGSSGTSDTTTAPGGTTTPAAAGNGTSAPSAETTTAAAAEGGDTTTVSAPAASGAATTAAATDGGGNSTNLAITTTGAAPDSSNGTAGPPATDASGNTATAGPTTTTSAAGATPGPSTTQSPADGSSAPTVAGATTGAAGPTTTTVAPPPPPSSSSSHANRSTRTATRTVPATEPAVMPAAAESESGPLGLDTDSFALLVVALVVALAVGGAVALAVRRRAQQQKAAAETASSSAAAIANALGEPLDPSAVSGPSKPAAAAAVPTTRPSIAGGLGANPLLQVPNRAR